MNYSFLLSLYIKEDSDFFNSCLSSLNSQTIRASETIIVYDGPITTELRNIVEKWRYKLNIKTIELPKNIGLGLALNEGLKKCANNIVARVDTDDIYLPMRMEKQLNFLKNNPEYVIVGSNIIEFKSTPGDLNRIRKVPESKEEIKNYIKSRNPFNHMSVTYKKDFILSIGGYKHHLYMEDYNLWIRAISKNANAHNLQANLVQVRIGHNNNMIKRRKGFSYVKSEYKLFKEINKFHINTRLNSSFIFAMRAFARILPTKILSRIYKHFREKVSL